MSNPIGQKYVLKKPLFSEYFEPVEAGAILERVENRLGDKEDRYEMRYHSGRFCGYIGKSDEWIKENTNNFEPTPSDNDMKYCCYCGKEIREN